MHKNLVILRCGRSSLHRGWTTPGDALDFDLMLCPYQEILPDPSAVLQTVVMPGHKWSGLYQLLTTWPGWRGYAYIWLPDDDLETDTATINRLFAFAQRFATTICAPSLSEDSFFSHAITMHHRKFFARAVGFLEVMMPCFRRDVLELALPSMAMSKTGTGWGLDGIWPKLVNYEGMMIFDALTVRHARPVGAVRDPGFEQEMLAEMHGIMAAHDASPCHKVIAALGEDGARRPADRQTFLLDYLNGYDYLIARDANMIAHLAALQAAEPPPAKPARRKLDFVAAAAEPVWQVDLHAVHALTCVILHGRADVPDAAPRLGVSGSLDGTAFHLMAAKLDGAPFNARYVFNFDPPIPARFLRVSPIGENPLRLDEIEVEGDWA